ncbi:Uncharacterized protein dnl_19060 [Desulfonema limicola]|uniref:Uncharacterized protein n=1 Tax=Desulfonema limicola TaxID=45656 RepID=A0A975GFT1_9BACT|nr:Uncharacterized protein dnl_19060 [Desulfonema limicola]
MAALAARAATGGCPYNMLQNLCAGAYLTRQSLGTDRAQEQEYQKFC